MRKISRTELKRRAGRKTSPELIETLSLAIKSDSWKQIAKKLSGPTKLFPSINLAEIESQTSAGDTIVMPGKVLSKGELTKKIKICALSISSKALAKLKTTKSDFVYLGEEIKKNPRAEGVKII